MRLGWRYQQMIRTFKNHAAAAFSQCTGAFPMSQGSVQSGVAARFAIPKWLCSDHIVDVWRLSEFRLFRPGLATAVPFCYE